MAARQQVRAFWPGWPLQTALAAAIVAVIALVLIVLAFGRPAVSAGEMSYTHRGQFTYTADAPTGLVYPDGTVETGDPVFLRLVDQVDVAFDYQPPTNGLTTTGQLWLEITDNSGWSTRTPLGEAQTAVDGLKATLQPAQLRRTIQQIGEETGVPAGAATIAVVASVAVEGHLHGQPIADDFVAQLHFQLDEHRLTPRIENGTDADAFVVTEDHSHTVPDAEAARLELAGRGIPVASARLLGPVLLIGALAAFATATSAARRRGSLDEPSRIDAQHGDRLVEVSDIGLPAGYGIVDVQQMDALARLAEQTERPILHHRLHEAHTYLVEGDATIYRYRTGEPSRTD